jgi:protein O-mannosyl-transferase
VPSKNTVIGLCVTLTLVSFGSSLWHGFSMIDDPYLVINNLAIRGPTLAHLHGIFTSFDPELYIPATLLSYQFNWLLGGLHPFIYHLTNLILHAANGMLVYILLSSLFAGYRRWLMLGVTLLWLCHPINTEAVVWVAGRKDLLSTFFVLSACIAAGKAARTRRSDWHIGSIGLFLAGLLSKVSIFPAPIIFAGIDHSMQKDSWRKSWLRIGPHIMCSIALVVVAIAGKTRVLQSSSVSETLLMAAKSTIFYLQKLVLPTGLTPLYPFDGDITLLSSAFAVPLLTLAAIAAVLILLARRNRLPLLSFLTFLALLSPTFFNFHKGTQMFFAVDRYAYLPSIALLPILVQLIERLSQMLSKHLMYLTARRILISGSALIISLLIFFSWRQTSTWASDASVMHRALALYTSSEPARLSLSVLARESGDVQGEERFLFEGLQQHYSVAFLTGLGSVRMRQARIDDARKLFDEAKILDPKNPEPLFFLGSLEEQLGNTAAAKKLYEQAITMDPSYTAARVNLGSILLDARNLEEAKLIFIEALQWSPNSFEAHANLFRTLELLHENEEAFVHLKNAYDLNPTNEEIVLSYAYRLSVRDQRKKAQAALKNFLKLGPSGSASRLLESLQ